MEHANVLTINSGSSSIKFSLYQMGAVERLVFGGKVERIGLTPSLFQVKDVKGKTLIDQRSDLPDQEASLKVLFGWLEDSESMKDLDAVGHRIVHGGMKFRAPHLVTEEVVQTLKDLSPMDPTHLYSEFEAIEAVGRFYPRLKQVACFGTAFHRHMPKVTQMYGLLIHKLAYRRTNHKNLHVRGYKEHGNINTPLELAIQNQIDRFNLAIDVIDRVPKLRVAGAHIKDRLKNQIVENTDYAHEHGIDKPAFTDWKWPY